MKTPPQQLPAFLRAFAVILVLCLLTSCGDPKYGPSGVKIATPATGSQVTGALSINGSYYLANPVEFNSVSVRLIRYIDNKAWDGTTWGGPGTTLLPATPNTTDKTWVCSAALPAGADLADGYYHITATMNWVGEEKVDHSIFSVGVTAPPVTSTLHSWGDNGEDANILGAGPGLPRDNNNPVPVFTRGYLDGKNVVAIAAGGRHTLALTVEGKVYAWGENAHGQLGTGNTTASFEPVPVLTTGVLSGKIVTAIAAGETHSLAVTRDGLVFAWGSGESGELGNGQSGGLYIVTQPVAVVMTGALMGKEVRSVAAGSHFSMALTSDGKLFSWGFNFYGQLGIGTSGSGTSSALPVAVQGLGAEFVATMSAGDHHWLCATNTEASPGKVFGCGKNPVGELGDGTTTDRSLPVQSGATGDMAGKIIQGVAAGYTHSLALDSTGRVYAWGYGGNGELGTGGTTSTSSPVQIAGPLAGKVATQARASSHSSLVVTADNKVFAFGDNPRGGLAGASAIGTDVLTPTEADFFAVLAGGRQLQQLAFGTNFALVIASPPPLEGPEIEVEAQGVELQDGGTINCGTFGVGTSNPVSITIRNRGKADLANLSAMVSGSLHFNGIFATAPLERDGAITFDVFFAPNTVSQPGPPLTATLQIFSNDADENPFDITLTGTSTPMGLADTSFNPNIPHPGTIIQSLSVQSDGMILPGGSAFFVNGSTLRSVARLDPVTAIADSFNPDASSGSVLCSAVLPDGKVMIGGTFTTVDGVARNRLARLNANGTIDPDFNAQITGSGTVFAIALQGDGKLVVSGNFGGIGGGSSPSLARLNPNGTLDTGWVPAGFGGRGVAVQADGKIVVVGGNGAGVYTVSRLSGVDGSLDPGFTRPTITSSLPDCLAVQPDGKILVGGLFTTVNGETRNGICRINTDGALDMGFNPNLGGTFAQATCIVLQANGRILISGSFTSVGGQTRNRIAMLGSDGALDPYFDPNADNAVRGIALQADGKVLAGGGFNNINGQAIAKLARLSNDTATQSLQVINGRIEWQRGGTSPETNLVTFDVSSDGGANWTPLGSGTRMSPSTPGWQLTGATLPATGQIRARAYPQGGYYSGSVSCLQTIAIYGTPPEITVTEGAVNYSSGNTRYFGVVGTGSSSAVMQLTIQNTGGTALTGLSGVSLVDNDMFDGVDHTTQFDLARPAAFTLAPGATTTMSVTFRPKTKGRHIAILRITNDDADENPFDIIVTGLGSEPITTWKQRYFGDTINSGAGADTADSDGDGVTNLEEYALGLDPTVAGGTDITITPPPPGGGSGFAPASFTDEGAAPPPSGGTFLFNYQRNKLALADVVFQIEWSDTLAENDWHTTDVTEQILSDDDSIQQVQATVPAGTAGRRFLRLKMTRL